MTRRDIIIIAVLVNAGLLATLFMLALNNDDDKIREPAELNATVIEMQAPSTIAPDASFQPPQLISLAPEAPTDEIDQALKAFAETNQSHPIIIEEENEEEPIPQPKEEEENLPTTDKKEVLTKQEKSLREKSVEVRVKKGDSLDKIARANNTTIKAIKELNNLKSDVLQIDQVLIVPVGEKSSSTKTVEKKSSPKAEIASNDSDPQYYTIKSGDNPWKIAKKFNIKLEDLLKLNKLNEDKARNLKVGEKIRVK